MREVKRTAGSVLPDLEFVYDPSGQRIMKIEKTKESNGGLKARRYWKHTVQGNVMAVYEANHNGSLYELRLNEAHIYGSNHLGVWKPNKKITASGCPPLPQYSIVNVDIHFGDLCVPQSPVEPIPMDLAEDMVIVYNTAATGTKRDFQLGVGYANTQVQAVGGVQWQHVSMVGQKQYELTDHLGNVMATVRDIKTGVDANSDNVAKYYLPQLLSVNDYYPFGMSMPGRDLAVSGGEYRFGYQSQEKIDEWNGEGNAYAFEYRIHDPRIGRFLSVDPIAANYPWNSPYAFAENDVIRCIDLEGLEKAVRNIGMHPFQIMHTEFNVWCKDNNDYAQHLMYKLAEQRAYASPDGQGQVTAWETAKIYLHSYMKHGAGNYTDLNDVSVLTTGKNMDNKDATATDYFCAGIGIFIPYVSGSAFKPLLKLEGAKVVGKCVEYAADFMKQYKKTLEEAGVIVTRYEVRLGTKTDGFIGTATQGFTDTGMHQFVLLRKGEQEYIFDNMHPEGILKTEYFKIVDGYSQETGLVSGAELMKHSKVVE